MRPVGRTRVRLAALLARHNITVDPADLWMQEGQNRGPRMDLARWGSYRAKWTNGLTPDGTPWGQEIHLHSWDTMTDCVREGIAVSSYERHGWGTSVEIHRAG